MPINIDKNKNMVGTQGTTEPLYVFESKSSYIDAQKIQIFLINAAKF